MKHVVLDCYGAQKSKLDNVKLINTILCELAYHIGVVSVAPPFLLPYYYCEEEQDVGISAFLFLRGGHITIHTFPYRECYFMDVLYDGFFETERIVEYLQRELPYEEEASVVDSRDRRFSENVIQSVDAGSDFGPHIMASVEMKEPPSMEDLFDFLEDMVKIADMTPISRPYLIKDTARNPRYLSGLILIAQSHIGIMYDYLDKVLYFDLFSCSLFDFSNTAAILERRLGRLNSYEVVTRGSKHDDKRATSVKKREHLYAGQWQRGMGGE